MVLHLNILHSFCFALLFNHCLRIGAEIFTAITDLEYLLETHKRIIDDLDVYINEEETRLSAVRRHLDFYKREHKKAMKDTPDYLGNPINAFTLIKRLTTDISYIKKGFESECIKNVTKHEDVKYPTRKDLTGAAEALTRLQKTYKLDAKDLAEGTINGVTYSTPMTASDCYELGQVLYKKGDYTNAREWLNEALRKYNEENILHPFTDVDILEYISFSYYLSGDTRSALQWTYKLLDVSPNHSRAKGNIPHYRKSIAKEEARLMEEREGESLNDKRDQQPVKLKGYAKVKEVYEALCRGDIDIPIEVSSRLTCRYMTENHPFLKIAPTKMEMMYLDPDIVLFHDVLYDSEIETIKEMSRPKLKRATVSDSITGKQSYVNYRISKSAWFRDKDSETVARISRRVTHMTGLSVRTAEQLQVANYGIGGHYEPHFDFAKKADNNSFAISEGNRIATVLFYMSDVAQGGATVFTELGLSVHPVKGAAAYWLNLHPSTEGDLATKHAACPVLQGSKWVCTKWIHQVGQEFLKPCNLEYQEEGISRKIPRSVPKLKVAI